MHGWAYTWPFSTKKGITCFRNFLLVPIDPISIESEMTNRARKAMLAVAIKLAQLLTAVELWRLLP
jgi:hypothetical protein